MLWASQLAEEFPNYPLEIRNDFAVKTQWGNHWSPRFLSVDTEDSAAGGAAVMLKDGDQISEWFL